MNEAAKTPIIDLLRSTPKDARAWYEKGAELPESKVVDGTVSHMHIPYGKQAHEAADEIERLSTKVKNIRDAAEFAYSEMAFAVHDLAGRRLTSDEAIDRRSEKLSKCADELRSVLDQVGQKS